MVIQDISPAVVILLAGNDQSWRDSQDTRSLAFASPERVPPCPGPGVLEGGRMPGIGNPAPGDFHGGVESVPVWGQALVLHDPGPPVTPASTGKTSIAATTRRTGLMNICVDLMKNMLRDLMIVTRPAGA